VTIAKRPSGRRDGEGYATDLGEARNEKFFAAGLDSKIARQPVGQITLIATPWLHVVVQLFDDFA
jgi:hypothetical protein